MAIKDIPEISEVFPGWEAWRSLVGGQIHARLKGSFPIVMVHAETEDGIRRAIIDYTGSPARTSRT